MGEITGIAWCDHTFNIVWGCLKWSAGCLHCYAETLARRYGFDVWGPKGTHRRREMSDTYWAQLRKWNRAAKQDGVRRRVFCGSMCDIMEDHPDLVGPRERLYAAVEACKSLDFLFLTKRTENYQRFLPDRWSKQLPANVWLGTSAEDQECFDERWPVLQETGYQWGASVIWLSLEPLLGPIDISLALEYGGNDTDHDFWLRPADWIIVGGESGKDHRPMKLDWVRSIRDQCQDEGIAFFYKQAAANKPGVNAILDGEVWHEFPKSHFEIEE